MLPPPRKNNAPHSCECDAQNTAAVISPTLHMRVEHPIDGVNDAVGCPDVRLDDARLVNVKATIRARELEVITELRSDLPWLLYARGADATCHDVMAQHFGQPCRITDACGAHREWGGEP